MTISECISKLAVSNTVANRNDFAKVFLESKIGFTMLGLPMSAQNEINYTVKESEVRMKYVTDPNGNNMIKACADPELFTKNYPDDKINALLTGRQTLEMLLKMNDVVGVLVCSATSFQSWPIYKNQAILLLKWNETKVKSKWWEFWKFA